MNRILALLLLAYSPQAMAQTYFSTLPFNLTAGQVADATQVNANLNSIAANGNAAIVALQAQLAAKGVGLPIPSGTIAPFYALSVCPAGWTSFSTTAGGYFIRGAGGGYTFANTALSSYASHYHQSASSFVNSSSTTALQAYVSGAKNYGASSVSCCVGAAGGTMASGNAATETRPVNVALLYCVKS